MFSKIDKPITEGIESQKEKLPSQLKALPGIEEQLALLPKSMSKDLTQGITGLTKGMQEAEKPKIQEYIPVDWEDEPVGWVPQDEFKKLEDYGREKMRITKKPVTIRENNDGRRA